MFGIILKIYKRSRECNIYIFSYRILLLIRCLGMSARLIRLYFLTSLFCCLVLESSSWLGFSCKYACKLIKPVLLWFYYFISFQYFDSYEVTATKFSRNLLKELTVSLVASLFMGFGVLFLMLWVGIYVWRLNKLNLFTFSCTLSHSIVTISSNNKTNIRWIFWRLDVPVTLAYVLLNVRNQISFVNI